MKRLSSVALLLALGGCTSHDNAASAPDAYVPVFSSARRTATTRGLLPTPTNNALADPFVTPDRSWGHFFSVVPATPSTVRASECAPLDRRLESFSPVGVTAPALHLERASMCTMTLAPLSGSGDDGAFDAQVWVTLKSASGAPLPLPSAAPLDGIVTVSLLPNALPTEAVAVAYPLALRTSPPLTLADGSVWGLISLPAPVRLPKGGWFVISFTPGDGVIELSAPAVVPTAAVSTAPTPRRATTPAEHLGIAEYGRLAGTRRPPRRL